METEEAADLIYACYRRGDPPPDVLRDTLDFSGALAVQLALLARHEANGERLGGWKIGLTSARVRERFGSDDQPFGFLLASRFHRAGDTFPLASLPHGAGIECELCFSLEEPLQGPGATPEKARLAVGALSAGMEINDLRSKGADFPLVVADGLAQGGVVVGDTLRPLPDDFSSDAVRATMVCGDEVMADVLGAEVIDDHFRSLAVLANTLAPFERRVEAGDRVITGSFSNHPVKGASSWRAEFSGVGRVAIRFV